MAAENKTSVKVDPARGQTFGSLAGNQAAIDGLRRMLAEERLPHALLFYGPQGVGKRSLAYALIRKLECQNGGELPDCDCRCCRKLPRNIGKDEFRSGWFDLHELFPESSGQQQFKVDSIREIEGIVHHPPVEGRRRVLLVHQADRMNPESANAFLKTLEEPPRHLQIILLTAQLQQLLPTVRSRCTALRLRPLPQAELADWLDVLRGPDENHKLLALLAEGCPGRALRMLESDALERYQQALQAMRDYNRKGYKRLTKTAYELTAAAGDQAADALGVMFACYRELLLFELTGKRELGAIPGSAQDTLDIVEAAAKYKPQSLLQALRLIIDSYDWSERMVNRQLAFEQLLLQAGAVLRK